jgi:hypothetical protein
MAALKRGWGRNAFIRMGLVVIALGVASASAHGDVIVLRGGGQIHGKVITDPKQPDKVAVILARGKTPLSFQKPQIVQVIPEPSALDEYVTRRSTAAATAEAQYELGLWCAEHKLADLAELHYEAALAHDNSYAPAHRKLGHVLHGDRWLSGDELREAKGLVKYKGKWITPEEKEKRAQNDESAAEQAGWVKRIRVLRDAIVSSSDDRRREAEMQLMEIRDSAAVAPLSKVLGGDSVEMRILLAHVLGVIPGQESASALVSLLLAESHPDVRHAVIDELKRIKDPEVPKRLVRALRSSTPEVVNRAAWALGSLNVVASVPSLVGALVSTRYEMVMAPAGGGSTAGSSIGASFGTMLPTYGPTGPLIGYSANGSTGAYVAGPVVGPGVAAYGAVGVPYLGLPGIPGGLGAPPSLAGTSINAGGGVSGTRGPVAQMVAITVQNSEVLSALVKMTGQDFGYDTRAWREWVRTSFEPNPVPARRVPQP